MNKSESKQLTKKQILLLQQNNQYMKDALEQLNRNSTLNFDVPINISSKYNRLQENFFRISNILKALDIEAAELMQDIQENEENQPKTITVEDRIQMIEDKVAIDKAESEKKAEMEREQVEQYLKEIGKLHSRVKDILTLANLCKKYNMHEDLIEENLLESDNMRDTDKDGVIKIKKLFNPDKDYEGFAFYMENYLHPSNAYAFYLVLNSNEIQCLMQNLHTHDIEELTPPALKHFLNEFETFETKFYTWFDVTFKNERMEENN